jgi:predicted DNA-binding transcriptional regulator AlpA
MTKHFKEPLPTELLDLRVLTLQEVADLCGISLATLKRLIADGQGPRTIQLSTRRVGVRVIDYKQWQQDRLRG